MSVILSNSALGESVPLSRYAGQTCAHFGSLFVGSDIDGRQMRGKGALIDPILHNAEASPARRFQPWDHSIRHAIWSGFKDHRLAYHGCHPTPLAKWRLVRRHCNGPTLYVMKYCRFYLSSIYRPS